jgi:uncharacterized protein involved in exopolysaccharide biosynthesis
MELLPILSILWRRRWLVIIGFVAALAAAYFLQTKPTLHGGTAAAQVMLDTPRSDLASSELDDTTNLGTRAALVAHAMVTEDVRDRLARSLGVKGDRVALVDMEFRDPAVPTTLPLAASEAALTAPEPYLLQMRFDGETPIISLEARAPDPAGAARLVDAAVNEIATRVPTREGPKNKPLTIERITDTPVRQLVSGQGRMMAVVAAGLLFGFWCLCLVAGTRLVVWFRRVPAA